MRNSPLDYDLAEMRRMAEQVTAMVTEHLASLREQPAFAGLGRPEAERLIAGPAPEAGRPFEESLAFLRERVFAWSAREPHPGFLAYVPSCPTFPAVMGDWLTAGYNCFGGAWQVGAGPSQVELVVLDWFRRWIGLPEGAGGLLTSGGSLATLTALVAARHAAVGDRPERLPFLVVYTSNQAHSSVARAAWIAGIPRNQVRSLPVDGEYRLRLDALEEAIRADRANGLTPFLVVASAGTTNTGSVDPLEAIAALCRRESLWFHVDAAYGGFAVLTDRGRAALRGLAQADSVGLDPHKWLFVPFECGCLLVREPRRLREAFLIFPEYLRDNEGQESEVNFADYGPQLTRTTRALKVWLSVQTVGLAAIRSAIDGAMNLALLLERRLRKAPGFEILSPARLGVCCFRASGAGVPAAQLDALNERLNRRLREGGRFFLSSTRLQGCYALRACFLGFRTTDEDVEALVRELTGLREKD